MFGFLKKIFQKKEDATVTEDEKQEAEAKKDIAEKGEDSQSEKDRIDESVGEQEHLDGNEDSQSAKDRIDESEGARKADEERAEKEEDAPAWAKEILSALSSLAEAIKAQPTPNEAANAAAEERMDAAFGIGNGVFQGDPAEQPNKRMTKEEIADVVSKLM